MSELPSGWRRVKLGEIAEVEAGGNAPQGQHYFGGALPFVRVKHFDGISDYLSEWDSINDKAVADYKLRLFKRDSIVLPKSGASIHLEKRALLPLDCYVVSHLAVVNAKPNVADNWFLLFALKTLKLATDSSGSTLPFLNLSHIARAEINFPPLPEQRAIAASLRAVQDAKDARRGEIELEGERKAALMRKLFSQGASAKTVKSRKTLYGFVPEYWCAMTLNQCAGVQTGAAKGRNFKDAGTLDLPYLRVANVQDGYLDLTEIKHITIRESEATRYLLKVGDVVVTEGGDADKLGRGFVWDGQIENCIHQNHVFAVRTDRDKLTPQFLSYLFQSPYGKNYFLSVAHRTTNLACINSAKLKAFPTVFPDLKEQQLICNALAGTDEKIAALNEETARLDELFRALLEELMSGRLSTAALISMNDRRTQ